MRQQTIDNDYIHRPDNRKLDHLPGDYGKPLIGYTFAMLKDPFSVFADMRARYGDVYRFNTTFQRMLIVSHPDYIKLLTLDPEQIFSPRMGYHGPLKDFFKGGLLMRDFGEHRVHLAVQDAVVAKEEAGRVTEGPRDPRRGHGRLSGRRPRRTRRRRRSWPRPAGCRRSAGRGGTGWRCGPRTS